MEPRDPVAVRRSVLNTQREECIRTEGRQPHQFQKHLITKHALAGFVCLCVHYSGNDPSMVLIRSIMSVIPAERGKGITDKGAAR